MSRTETRLVTESAASDAGRRRALEDTPDRDAESFLAGGQDGASSFENVADCPTGSDLLAIEAEASNSADVALDLDFAVEDLEDDWHRQGRTLTYDDVLRLATKRGFTPDQIENLVGRLSTLGIEIERSHAESAGLRDAMRLDEDGFKPEVRTSGRHQADGLGRYFKLIGRSPLLRAEEEVELWRRIDTMQRLQDQLAASPAPRPTPNVQRVLKSGKAAHDELVYRNLRLVVSIARRHAQESAGMDFEDLIQEGTIGLMRAADKFDGSKGFKFSTYATWWIRQAITRAIADKGRTIRIPVHMYEKVMSVRRRTSELTVSLGREPSIAEVSQHTGFDLATVAALRDLDKGTASFSAPTGEGDTSLGDLIADQSESPEAIDPADVVIGDHFVREVDDLMRNALAPREATIIQRRYGFEGGDLETLQAIADDVGVTRERVRQLENMSLDTMRGHPKLRPLYIYLLDDSRDDNPKPSGGWPVATNSKKSSKKRSRTRKAGQQ